MENLLETPLKQLLEVIKERENALDNREKELENREHDLINREKKLQRLKEALKNEYPNATKPDDVLLLDVGGSHITVLRKTFTQVEDSLLASKFSGQWDDSLEKTPEGRFFIDQPIEIFLPLVNYLRALALAPHTPLVGPPRAPNFQRAEEQQQGKSFYRMVEYYKMTHAVFPMGIYRCHSNASNPSEPETLALIADHPRYQVESERFQSFFLRPLNDRHCMRIKSFEVKLHDVSDAQIGWAEPSHRSQLTTPFGNRSARFSHHGWVSEDPKMLAQPPSGVGYAPNTTAYDVVRSAMVANGQVYPVPNPQAKAGSVIRCEDRGAAWFIDGKLVTPNKIGNTGVWAPISLSSNVVPCVSVKGRVEFITFEFLY